MTTNVVDMEGSTGSLDLDILQSGVDARKYGLDVAEILNKQSRIMEESAMRSKEAADAAGRQAASLTIGNLAVQDAMQKSVELLSGDVMNPNSLKAKSMEEFTSRAMEASAMLEDVKQTANVSFFDDPLGYIVNQMNLPQKVQQYNLTATQANTALRTVNDIDSTLTQEHSAQQAAKKTLTTQSIADSATLASQVLEQQASEWKMKALGNNIDAAKAIKDGNAAQVAAQMTLWNKAKTEEGLRMQQEAAARQQQLSTYIIEEHNDKMLAKKYLRETIAAGRAVYHLPTSPEQLDALETLYKTPEGKQQLQRFIDAGTTKLSGNGNETGITPGDSAFNLKATNGNWKDSESLGAIQELLSTTQNLQATGQYKKAQELKDAINKHYFGTVSPDGKSRTPGIVEQWNASAERSTRYNDPGLLRVTDSDFVNETPFFKTVLAPSVAAGTQKISASAMVDMGAEAVREGKLSLEQVSSGIATYYQTVGMINAMNNRAIAIPPQEGYKASIYNTGGIFADKVDLAKTNQVMSVLLKTISSANKNSGILGTGIQQGELGAGPTLKELSDRIGP